MKKKKAKELDILRPIFEKPEGGSSSIKSGMSVDASSFSLSGIEREVEGILKEYDNHASSSIGERQQTSRIVWQSNLKLISLEEAQKQEKERIQALTSECESSKSTPKSEFELDKNLCNKLSEKKEKLKSKLKNSASIKGKGKNFQKR